MWFSPVEVVWVWTWVFPTQVLLIFITTNFLQQEIRVVSWLERILQRIFNFVRLKDFKQPWLNYCSHLHRLPSASGCWKCNANRRHVVRCTSVAKLHNAENDGRLKQTRTLQVIGRASMRYNYQRSSTRSFYFSRRLVNYFSALRLLFSREDLLIFLMPFRVPSASPNGP